MEKAPIKNTRSRSPNVFARIQKILIQHGAREFTFEMDDQGQYAALRFAVEVNGRLLHFRMPANVDKVRKALMQRAKTIAQSNAYAKNAYQVAWANVRDWLDVQMALVDINMVDLPQVFLPYALNEQGKTFYESMQERQFLLPERSNYRIVEE